MRIYILEDNIAIAQLVTLLLKRRGYEAEAFYNVKTFMNATKGLLPDLCILDVMLPDGNGLEIAQQFKQTDFLKEVPILIMSANVDCAKEAKSLYTVDYIAKPFDISDFYYKLENLVLMAKN